MLFNATDSGPHIRKSNLLRLLPVKNLKHSRYVAAKHMNKKTISALILLLISLHAHADKCSRINFGVVGWTDVKSTTAIAQLLLERLGYRISVQEFTVPDLYQALAAQRIDVFLGNWLPSMQADIQPFLNNGSVEMGPANLVGAKYTLAVPKYVSDAGIRTFQDLAANKDQFRGYIYGLEKGNDGNRIIQSMIQDNAYELGQFSLVPTSERILMAQIRKHIRDKKWIVFLGWEPHPMNEKFEVTYLSGDEQYFGPNYGGSTIHTNFRKQFRSDCPNASQLISNLKFSTSMENVIMDDIDNRYIDPRNAAWNWLSQNPEVIQKWLSGVESIDANINIAGIPESFSTSP